MQTSAIKAQLIRGPVLACDETGLRVVATKHLLCAAKANWWLWVFQLEQSAVFVAAARRCSKAVVAHFLGEWRPDFWISDRSGGQKGWATKAHQFCLAHLIRDAQ